MGGCLLSRDECEHDFDPQKGFTVHTTRAYQPGEQIFINYGHHANLRLLRNYGFTLPSNPHDVLELPLPDSLQKLQPSDAMLSEKHELLQSLLGNSSGGKAVTKKTLQVASDGQLSVESQQWLQILLASREELQSIFQQASATSAQSSPSSPMLQLPPSLVSNVQTSVKDICTQRLATHKSSLEVRCHTDASLSCSCH